MQSWQRSPLQPRCSSYSMDPTAFNKSCLVRDNRKQLNTNSDLDPFGMLRIGVDRHGCCFLTSVIRSKPMRTPSLAKTAVYAAPWDFETEHLPLVSTSGTDSTPVASNDCAVEA
eukprot:4295974-Amphidinium_carterae.1